YIHRRETARATAKCKSGQRVDRIELVSASFDQCSAKMAIEEILLRHFYRQYFVRLLCFCLIADGVFAGSALCRTFFTVVCSPCRSFDLLSGSLGTQFF